MAPAASQQSNQKTATHVIMVTPMDFRLVTIEGGVSVAAASTAKHASIVSLSSSDVTVAVQSKKVERMSALRQQKQERDTRSLSRFDSMPAEQKQRHEAALRERSEALRTQWNSKRAAWQHMDAAREEQRTANDPKEVRP